MHAYRDPRAWCDRTEGRFDPYGNKKSLGYIYKSYSRDGGVHWINAQPTTLISPVSPTTIKRIPTGDLLLTQNNSPHKRCPLTSTVSHDEGEIWRTFKNIETAEKYNYAYPSVTFVEKRLFPPTGSTIRFNYNH